MKRNQAVRAGKRIAALVFRISSAFHCSAMLSVLMLAALGLAGCAGLVSGTTSNPPPSTLTISNVQNASTTTSASQIVWTTNVAADSVVNYGTTPSYGSSTPVNSSMVTNHQVVLSGLAPDTTYYYEVASTDSKGNHGKSGGHSFKTLGFSISGTITPIAGGSGATLTLTGAANGTTTSDASGNYTFTGLPNGPYTISPSHSGFTFTPSSQSTTINGANVTGVNFADTAASSAPTITAQPANQTVTVGQTATFAVVATGTAPLSFQWSKNGVAISGATSSTYTTPAATSSDSGAQFAVIVSNSVGNVTSAIATLTVSAAAIAPTITTQPANQAVTAGQTASFSVLATGTAPLSYQWNKNGTAISGAMSSTYITPATTTSDSGAQFTVVLSNSAGSVTSTAATLTVNAAPVAPAITTQPVNQMVTAGQTATFTVTATGTAPLSYQWRKNGSNIAGAIGPSYTTPATVTADNNTTFDVIVSNALGSVTSSSATLSVSVTSLAISTTSLPAGTVGQGYSSQLNATGGTAPYTWTITSGSLPAGLTLSSSGAISGTPTTAGTSSFTVQVTDASLLTAQQNLSISTTSGTACAPTGSGVCYYVDPTGSDSNPGTSSSPFLTIQQAANVVNPGDMVIVRDGTYSNAALSGVGSKLVVMSHGGTASNHVVFVAEHKWGAKINGLNNTTATGWEFSANYIDVKDFDCAGFSDTCMENYNGGSSSGGQFIDIAGNNIHDVGRYCTTTTTGRDGIFISNDNVIIEENQIHDIGRYAPGENGCTNPAHYQNNDHGIYIDGAFTSANNLTIKNNIFYRNERGWSIQVYPGAVSNLRILNNSFVCGNPYRNGHITLAAPITNSAIENNISWQPTTGFLQYDNTSGYSNLSVANNLTYQGTVGAESAPAGVVLSGNLDNTDPMLVSAPGCTVDDPSVPNAYLQVGSPAIDAGLTLADVPLDYVSTPRPQGIRFDIGAFEYIF